MSRILVLGIGPMPFEQPRRVYGGSNRAWHFARPLRDAGHRVTLVSMRTTDNTRKDGEHRHYEVEGLDFHSINETDHLRNDAFMTDLLERAAPDGIVGVNTLPAWRACTLPTDAPIWVDLMGYTMGEAQVQAFGQQRKEALYLHWDYLRVCLRRGDVFSSLGEPQTAATVGELGCAGRLTAATLGYRFVHTMPIAREGEWPRTGHPIRDTLAGPDDVVALWQGGYNYWMDPDTLVAGVIEALQREPRLRFVSIGGMIDGHDEISYPRVCEGLEQSPVADRVHLLGWVPPDQVGNYLHDADVGINVDRECYESHIGGRNRITDMMHAGLPIITTLASEITQVVRDEGCGRVFAIGDAAGFADCLVWAARHRAQLPELGARGRAFAQAHYTFDATTQAVRQWAQAPWHAPDWPQPGPPLGWHDPAPPAPPPAGLRQKIKRLLRP